MSENVQTNETNVGSTAVLEAKLAEAIKRAEAAEAEASKQKGLKDTYAKENAEYKRKQEAQMSDEEKRAKEMQELAERAANAEKKMAEMEHRQSGLENGFTADEVAKLVGTGIDFKILKDIIAARVEEAVKSAKAEATKTSTTDPLLGNGTATGGEAKSDFQRHQESKAQTETIVKL